MSLNKLYESIQNPSFSNEGSRYHVVTLPGLLHKLGCTEEGHPKFFIDVQDTSASLMKNYNAEILSIEFDVKCNIIEDGECIDDRYFSIITLHSDNEQLHKTFIDVFYAMLRILPDKPTRYQLASKIENLLSIFSKLKRKPLHKLQGLWAELLVIECSSNPDVVAKAWHNSPCAKYDFTLGSDKIEVKSTSREERVHKFSVDQLNPSENSNLLVCSVLLRESGKDVNGLSIYDLYQRISEKITSDEVRLHVYDVLLDTIGSDFYTAQDKYFDYSTARDSLSFYDYIDVPRIEKEAIPKLVTEVRFSSDLSHLTDVRDKDGKYKESTLFKNFF